LQILTHFVWHCDDGLNYTAAYRFSLGSSPLPQHGMDKALWKSNSRCYTCFLHAAFTDLSEYHSAPLVVGRTQISVNEVKVVSQGVSARSKLNQANSVQKAEQVLC